MRADTTSKSGRLLWKPEPFVVASLTFRIMMMASLSGGRPAMTEGGARQIVSHLFESNIQAARR